MKKDLKTTRNRPQKSLASKLQNQSREIPLTQVATPVLPTNISAAC